ncbi:MAG: VTC domain-containing protein [Desulfuromonadales bacterium]|nr:VTC domain-containing protein [Desulfuromonadales bacterium]
MSCHAGFMKAYPDRMINSVYFDTLDLVCAKDNIAGISERQKYRLRWYGELASSYGARYETKVKRASLGYKEVQVANIDQRELIGMDSAQVMETLSQDKIGSLWSHYPLLKPSTYVQYEREYFEAYRGIRLTIDKSIQFNEIAPGLHLDVKGHRFYDGVVVEIKFDPSERPFVAELMRDFPFYPVRMSKYVLGLSLFSRVCYL